MPWSARVERNIRLGLSAFWCRRSQQGDRHCTQHGSALRRARQARSGNLRDVAPEFLGENAFAHFAEREFSEDTTREIDCSARELTTGASEKAPGILRKYRSQLECGAKLLLEKETLMREELPPLQERQPLST